ncbi:MAG TPA: esterase-like activity of phytase family protein [Phenylobacterium sp.]|nr:esterase-like activity of phytase family protein [Phenylobacterium sp.]
MKRLLLGAALLLASCAQPPAAPRTPVAAGPGITIHAEAAALNPSDPSQDHIGAFVYAGGLVLSSTDTARLHGLSDLKVLPGGRLVSNSDDGDLLEARLTLDPKGRLVGLADARIAPLGGPDGKPLQGKQEADSEGLAILADGDRLISFERHNRILLYPAKGGPPHEVPAPDAQFPENGGMEALTQDPAAGPDAYVVGGEDSGQTWNCTLAKGCAAGRLIPKPAEFGLVAMAPLPGGGMAHMLRAWDPLRGSRIALVVADAKGAEIDRLELARPFTVDNLEGVAVVPAKDGTIRFYLISDDNFMPSQRTLLLAFDWKPPAH